MKQVHFLLVLAFQIIYLFIYNHYIVCTWVREKVPIWAK